MDVEIRRGELRRTCEGYVWYEGGSKVHQLAAFYGYEFDIYWLYKL
jgi:hypothetical protein